MSLLPPGQDASAGTTVEVVLDEPLPTSWAGQGVRVSVTTAASEGDVLAVPLGAVFMGTDGQPEVVVATTPSHDAAKLQTRRVAVAVGAIGGGYAEVSSEDPVLKAGTSVLLSSPPE